VRPLLFDVALIAGLLAVAILLTVLLFLVVDGPAVEVFKVPASALKPEPYYYYVPQLPSPSLPVLLSCIAARCERAGRLTPASSEIDRD
jgi:hypothetical protein